MRKRVYVPIRTAASVLITTTICPICVTPAFAQEQSTEQAAPVQEVQVTGSRIQRRDLDAPSPIVTVEDELLTESSTVAVESVLNQLPQFAPAGTQFVTGDIFPTAINSPGAATLNLRALGTNRTLVLLDGRRGQPINSTLVIDTNSIPAAAIESVEVISGGASAVYGADAMAGVVNFRLKRSFEGASLNFRSGMTEAGDGEENTVSALLGANIAEGRGNAMLGLEWSKREAALAAERPFFTDAWYDAGAPATLIRMNGSSYEPNSAAGGLPSQTAVNGLYPNRSGDVARTTPFFLNADDTLFKQAGALGYNGPLNDGRYKMQPNGTLGENNLAAWVSSPLTRYSIFGKTDYEINDNVQLFTQLHFVSTEVASLSQPAAATGGFSVNIPRDAEHPIPAQLAALLDSRGPNVLSTTEFDPTTGLPLVVTGVDADWALGRTLDFLPPRGIENTTRLFQVLAGLRGEVGLGDWSWEAYLSHGDTENDSNYVGYASMARYEAVATAPFYGRGFTADGVGQTTLTCTSGLPIFESFQVSQDCIDAITVSIADTSSLSQDIVEANFEGGLFDLPAGQVRSAMGLSYRKNNFDFLPDATRESNNIVDIPISVFGSANVRGKTDVKEIYAEVLLPLLRDKPLARSFELELGGRYSDYNTAGGTPTYKALFSWAPVDIVRFRGGYQLANRAPNINELFLGASNVPVVTRGPDPCRVDTRDSNGNVSGNPNRAQVQTLCSQIIGTGTSEFDADPNNFRGDGRIDGGEIEVRFGNLGLESEEGRTYTFGMVLTSPFESPALNNMTLALDWYQVKISDAIGQVSAQTAYDICFNRDGVSNPTYSLDDPNGQCRQIVRDPVSGNRLFVNSPYENLGTLETSGLDIQLNWGAPLADLGLPSVPGALSVSLAFNKLFDFKSQDFPAQPALENAGTLGTPARQGLFDYRAFTTVRYSLGGANVGLQWRRLPSVRHQNFVTDPQTPFLGAESYSIFDLSGGWRISDSVSLTGGVDNIFDKDPNRTGIGPTTNASGTTVAGLYDVLGRRYYAGVRLDF